MVYKVIFFWGQYVKDICSHIAWMYYRKVYVIVIRLAVEECICDEPNFVKFFELVD